MAKRPLAYLCRGRVDGGGGGGRYLWSRKASKLPDSRESSNNRRNLGSAGTQTGGSGKPQRKSR